MNRQSVTHAKFLLFDENPCISMSLVPLDFQQVDTVVTINKQRKQVRYQLLSLPLYLVERLDDIVNRRQGQPLQSG